MFRRIDLCPEWAKVEVADSQNLAYNLVTEQGLCRAGRFFQPVGRPDTSSFTDPELVLQPQKANYIGLTVNLGVRAA